MAFSERPILSDLTLKFTQLEQFISSLIDIQASHDNILIWFQGLCNHFTTIINQICILCKNNSFKEALKNTILLYLTQMVSSLSLLINILVSEEENGVILKEARKCIIKQISCCLELLLVAIRDGKIVETSSGNFVEWMDKALQKITEINNERNQMENFIKSRRIFEEVLSHAMSIAQVSLIEDSKSIRGSCQTVLSTLTSLETELKSFQKNKAVVSLYVDSCGDKLCSLEKKVNTAVLKLCLDTFSNLSGPLDRIHNFCLESSNRSKIDEFDSLVVDFDLHVDRIMQIGLFAVSCSSDLARGIKIRSCLASLEGLETELVPTLNSLLVDKSNFLYSEILVKYWLEQATNLRNLIFLIIDPFAFCQVIYQEISILVDNLSNLLRKKNSINQSDINNFLKIAKVLKIFLDKTWSELNEKEKEKIQTKLKDYNEVLEEIEKASSVLLTPNPDLESSQRVLKRCKILVTVLKRLWICFADDLVNHNCTEIKEKSDKEIETGNHFLDHIINRGRQILQDRSVLYKTPIKNLTKIKSQKEVPLSKLVHLRKLSFMNIGENNETSLNLQITDILNEMSTLSTKIG